MAVRGLEKFLEMYSPENPEWPNIEARLRAFGLQELPAGTLLATIRDYYKLQ